MIKSFIHPIIDYHPVWIIVIFTRSHFSLCCRHTLKLFWWGDCTILLWRNSAKLQETDCSKNHKIGGLIVIKAYLGTGHRPEASGACRFTLHKLKYVWKFCALNFEIVAVVRRCIRFFLFSCSEIVFKLWASGILFLRFRKIITTYNPFKCQIPNDWKMEQ